jgi:opacity protein-like surface antigen
VDLRPIRIALVLGALALSSPVAHAQIIGQFTGAEPVTAGGRVFGGYAYSSENVLGLLAQLRLSFYPGVDFGFNGGFSRVDSPAGDRTTITLGTGFKVKVSEPSASIPVALAIGGDLGIETGDEYHVLTLAPSLIASRNLAMGDNASFTPYGRIGLAVVRADIGSESDSDVSVPLRFGADFQLAPQLRLVGELQFNVGDAFNDNLGFGLGVNLPF